MATKHPDSAPRLGGVLISNQVVAELDYNKNLYLCTRN